MRAATTLAALLLWYLSLLLTIWMARTSVAERPYATPFLLPGELWPAVTAAVIILTAAAMARAWRQAPAPAARRRLAELALMPGLLIAWLAGRPASSGIHPWDLAWGTTVAAVALWQARGTPRRGPAAFARRGWLATDILFVALPLAAGLAGGAEVRAASVVTSVLLYPVYALGQLALVLVLPYPRLAALAGERAAIAGCAAFFALVHWPNPVLMGVTGVAMAVWAAQYRQGRRLAALAVSMGLAATAFTQFLPVELTAHMRVGPGFVRQRAAPMIAEAAARPSDRAFVAALYPDIVGRPAAAGELDRWQRAIASGRRAAVARIYFVGDEYRRRIGEPAGEPPLRAEVLWRDIDRGWLDRINFLASDDHAAACGGTWQGFIACMYREILRRESTVGEIEAWSPTLTARERQRVVEILLERRGQLARAPFDTLTAVEFAFSY